MSDRELWASLLHYDPDTGVFVWKPRANVQPVWNVRHAGKEAGTVHRGYRFLHCHGRRVLAHRIAWLLHYGEMPLGELDHINRNRLDNRIANLRPATRAQNQQNQRRPKLSASGFRGVERHHSKWHARITANGVKHHVGSFATAEEAAAAYWEAARRLHGEFAYSDDRAPPAGWASMENVR